MWNFGKKYRGREGKHPVRMISTFINAANSNGKPKIVQHYNMNIGGVDGGRYDVTLL